MPKQPFVPVGQVLRGRVAGLHYTSPWQNGFCLQYAGSRPDTGALAILADSISTAWNTSIAPIMLTSVTVQFVQLWDLTDATGAVGISNAKHTGSLTTTAELPIQAAVAVSWPISSRFRGGHFRSYVPARGAGDLTNMKTLIQTAIDAYKNAYQAWQVAVNQLTMNGGSISLGGVRYFPTGFDANGKPLVKTSGTFYKFGLPLVHSRLDTQRRRLGKEVI